MMHPEDVRGRRGEGEGGGEKMGRGEGRGVEETAVPPTF